MRIAGYLEYLEIPRKRKEKTIELLPHMEKIFLGAEEVIYRNPEECPIVKEVDGVYFRVWELKMPEKIRIQQEIPRIRMRIQHRVSPTRRLLVDALAVYDHEMQEIDLS